MGIHCQHGERTEFIDLLSDGRIRYSLRDGNTIEQQRVLSSEEAAAFVSIRATTLRNASLFLSSYDTSKPVTRVLFTGSQMESQFALPVGIGETDQVATPTAS